MLNVPIRYLTKKGIQNIKGCPQSFHFSLTLTSFNFSHEERWNINHQPCCVVSSHYTPRHLKRGIFCELRIHVSIHLSTKNVPLKLVCKSLIVVTPERYSDSPSCVVLFYPSQQPAVANETWSELMLAPLCSLFPSSNKQTAICNVLWSIITQRATSIRWHKTHNFHPHLHLVA